MFDIFLWLVVVVLLYVAAIALSETSYGWQPVAQGRVTSSPKVYPRHAGRYHALLMREDLICVFIGSLCMIALLVVLWLAGFSAITLPLWLYSAVLLFCYIGDTASVMTSQRPAGYE